MRAQRVALGHGRQAAARRELNAAGRFVGGDPGGVGVGVGIRQLACGSVACPQHGALGRVGINQDIGEIA